MLAAPVVGCGPKKPPTPEEGAPVNPKQAFLAGVQILQTPGKDGAIDYAAAYASFSGAVEVEPGFAKAQYNAGWTAERMGNLPQAATHYRAALAAESGYSNALFALCDVLTRQGQGMEAVDLYKAYLEANPGALTVRNNLIEALIAAELYDDAISQSREVLMQDPKDVGAYRNLSRLYFTQGDYGMSQLCAEKAKTLAEGDSGIYNNIGVTYLVMEKEPAAIKEFETAVKLDSDHVEANLNLGYVALNSGDYSLAQACFSNALKGEPGNIDAKLGLAVSLRGVKDYDNARKLYEEVLAVGNASQMAYFNAATLYEKYIKDYKKALKVLQGFVDANQGQIGPDHEVYNRMERVKESQAIEEERKREEDRKRKEAEERKKRQQQVFEDLKTKVGKLSSIIETYSGCEMMVESGGIEMGQMVLEQAQMVVEAEEIDMAGDVMTFIDEVMPQLEGIIPECGAGGGSDTPAEGAPGEEAPAEEAPGEEAPAKEGGE